MDYLACMTTEEGKNGIIFAPCIFIRFARYVVVGVMHHLERVQVDRPT